VPATRVEIAQHIANVFTGTPVTRNQIVGAAERTGARPAVLHVLRGLPMGPFHDLRQLWPALPDVPIEPRPANPMFGSLPS
jgi:hypothetical protein